MSRETEEFAALMRELKERSGRSYGALAARLHASSSSLHRYCNGTAVPHEFGPVERFGRLCGATREELVDLHRRWVLADDARHREPVPARRSGAPDAPAEAPSAPGAAPAPEPAPEPSDAEAAAAPG
ncbi:helix-turn-helix transcriptional regulator, partial [Streptomyces sp. B1866]|uniref:helix-turn-helix domain-containing protein n=1 Tax=Streptomyces sp. B1866 TaxID=3075431 RepID=UPI0028909B35